MTKLLALPRRKTNACMATYAQAKAMLRRRAAFLLRHKNVVAIGVGRKNGDRGRRDWCIRIHVTEKTGQRTRHSVPRTLYPPKHLKWMAPVHTDVEQMGHWSCTEQFELVRVSTWMHPALAPPSLGATGIFSR
jgi:hypothetical protein